ncbi:MAG: hemolysin family protein [Oscillospiraceae bacterium]|nr:hemolysin family protein [Oscillospiraceae bacterium]
MQSTLTTVLTFLLLFILSALFSAGETALTGANRIRLKTQSEQGDKSAARALRLIENYNTSLNTLLIGNNVVNTLTASIATVVCTKLFAAGGVGVATLLVTILIIVFGEVIPKSFANANSEKIIKAVSGPISFLKAVLRPVSAALEFLKKLILHSPSISDPSVTEEELRVIIEEIEDEGVIEEDQSALLQSALEFGDIVADEILTPRVDIFAVEKGADKEEILQMFLEQNFSRIPVYDKTIDNIIGVVNQKDFFAAVITNGDFSMETQLQKCLYIPPKKHIDELMTELQHKKLHMAIVTDQYGGTLGLVTLEDILEELVGEIWDEHEEVTSLILPVGENVYEVSGEMPVEELYEQLAENTPLPATDAATVAGFTLEVLGHIPQTGESFETPALRFTVAKVDEQRILKLHVTVILPQKEGKHK